ncbi:glutamate receptor ionotropic, kainate glr-3-like [Penaeus indicus]|uniref:glutamate receptor ionotropic, kainate glr-3-like n=1 Tax=Penaeus indicus TaxID=29960 RepID=UPI00300D7D2F
MPFPDKHRVLLFALIGSVIAKCGSMKPLTGFSDVMEDTNTTRALLNDLLSGPLAGRNIFFVLDEGSFDDLTFEPAFHVDLEIPLVLLASQDSLEEALYPRNYLRDEVGIVIIMTKASPMAFLDRMAASPKWRPMHLILISTGASVNTHDVLRHRAVQRSPFLVLFELTSRAGRSVFQVFTSYPFRPRGWRFPLGLWDDQTFATMDDLFLDRFDDFGGADLQLASWCDDYPFIYLDPAGDGCKGSNLDALAIMGARLNFSFSVQRETQDQNWGALENGSWTGMLGDLVYNGKHIVINYFLVNYERWRDFDATDPYHAEGFGFLVRKPPPLPKWRSLTYPFAPTTWGAILGATLVVALILAAILPGLDVGAAGGPDRVKYAVLVCAGMTRQSVSLVPTRAWERLGLGWWWLGCIIISTAFTGNLIAFLSVPVYPVRVETVAQLAISDLRVTMQDYGEFVPEELKRSSDESLYTIGHKLDLFPYDQDYDPGIEGVMRRTHVLIESYSYLMNVQIRFNVTKDTYLMKEQVYPGHLSWFLPKNTAYTTKISRLLTRLKEVGLLQKLFKNHFQSVASFEAEQRTGPQALSIAQLQGAFLLLAFGGVTSLVILFIEVILGSRFH